MRLKKNISTSGPAVKILLMAFFLLFQSEILPAQETGGRYIDEALQMKLADQFFNEGDLEGAIREYKRFLFFFPHSVKADEALVKIAESYFNGRRWEEAIVICDDLIKKFPSSSLKSKAFLVKGEAMAGKKQYPQARVFLQKAQEISPGTPTADEAQLQIARTFLQEEKWKEAAHEFRKIDKKSKLYPKGEYFAQGLDLIQELPQKSPVTAGVLSAVLPGAGQVYTERYGEAVIAFLLNGAFIWGMVASFADENYVVGGILTFFELGWYSANIVNAVNSARKYNRNKKLDYLDRLEKESNFTLGYSPQGKTPVLVFNYAF
ncbi:MAG: tetratricopeptide repeat protein [Deltaproteobacteria bacterium]|nr:tetratricopeptide repeat protein [Deltaproteobacteria bacterium]